MQKLVFATNNNNKVEEVRMVIGDLFDVVSLRDAGINQEIDEPYDTLEENARGKSKFIFDLTGNNCFSEDTGLEVSILQNEPGVRSARYAGEPANDDANVDKLLDAMQGLTDRNARFRTIISLYLDGNEYQFEGICSGKITGARLGNNGFGYDPVFVPDGAELTFAAMSMEEKNIYSHRKKAVAKLLAFLSINWK